MTSIVMAVCLAATTPAPTPSKTVTPAAGSSTAFQTSDVVPAAHKKGPQDKDVFAHAAPPAGPPRPVPWVKYPFIYLVQMVAGTGMGAPIGFSSWILHETSISRETSSSYSSTSSFRTRI